MDALPSVETIDKATLSPIVNRVLDAEVELVDWRREAVLGGIAQTSGGIYRFTGSGLEGDREVPWSLILKTIRPADEWAQGTDGPTRAWGYWKRELLAYQSGLLASLPGNLIAPRCYGTVEWSDGAWLWLEEVRDDFDKRWPLERFHLAARHLGVLHATYLVDRPLPKFPWLSRGGVRAWCERCAVPWSQLPKALEDPLLRRYWPGDLAERSLRLVENRRLFLDAFDHLPQTLCHQDATFGGRLGNLFARRGANGQEETVAIDWAFVGIGGIGMDLGSMLFGAALYGAKGEDLRQLEGIIFEGYLDGLRAVGWQGDPRLPRLGYLVELALRLSVMPYGVFHFPEDSHERIRRATGLTYEEVCERFVPLRRFVAERGEQAFELVQALG